MNGPIAFLLSTSGERPYTLQTVCLVLRRIRPGKQVPSISRTVGPSTNATSADAILLRTTEADNGMPLSGRGGARATLGQQRSTPPPRSAPAAGYPSPDLRLRSM